MSVFKNLVGQKFGRLLIVAPTEERSSGNVVWLCDCDCGTEQHKAAGHRLKNGTTRSCGCLVKERAIALGKIHGKRNGARSAVNLTEQRFGRLVALHPTAQRSGDNVVWKLVCDCGETAEVSTGNLRNGNVKSCGCLNSELSAKRCSERATHKHSGSRRSPTYVSWVSMIQRSTNPAHDMFPHYGGAGVKVCDRWLNSFEAFLADMGERPEGTTLGRYADVGDYEPGNVSWMTRAEQELEKRNHRGLAKWAEAASAFRPPFNAPDSAVQHL